MTEREAGTIKAYTETNFLSIVQYQRTGEVDEGLKREKLEEQISTLENALLKEDSWEGSSYRGMDFDTEADRDTFLESIEEGNEYEFSAFQSTSKSESYAREHLITPEGVLIEISGKSGRDIAKYSFNSEEEEVLFLKGARFNVISKESDRIILEEI